MSQNEFKINNDKLNKIPIEILGTEKDNNTFVIEIKKDFSNFKLGDIYITILLIRKTYNRINSSFFIKII